MHQFGKLEYFITYTYIYKLIVRLCGMFKLRESLKTNIVNNNKKNNRGS